MTFTERKTQKLFKGLVVGFGPKGMPGRTLCVKSLKEEERVLTNCSVNSEFMGEKFSP